MFEGNITKNMHGFQKALHQNRCILWQTFGIAIKISASHIKVLGFDPCPGPVNTEPGYSGESSSNQVPPTYVAPIIFQAPTTDLGCIIGVN